MRACARCSQRDARRARTSSTCGCSSALDSRADDMSYRRKLFRDVLLFLVEPTAGRSPSSPVTDDSVLFIVTSHQLIPSWSLWGTQGSGRRVRCAPRRSNHPRAMAACATSRRAQRTGTGARHGQIAFVCAKAAACASMVNGHEDARRVNNPAGTVSGAHLSLA
jgi:hypothetical protein